MLERQKALKKLKTFIVDSGIEFELVGDVTADYGDNSVAQLVIYIDDIDFTFETETSLAIDEHFIQRNIEGINVDIANLKDQTK